MNFDEFYKNVNESLKNIDIRTMKYLCEYPERITRVEYVHGTHCIVGKRSLLIEQSTVAKEHLDTPLDPDKDVAITGPKIMIEYQTMHNGKPIHSTYNLMQNPIGYELCGDEESIIWYNTLLEHIENIINIPIKEFTLNQINFL